MFYIYDHINDHLRYYGDNDTLEYSMSMNCFEGYVRGIGTGVKDDDLAVARFKARVRGLLKEVVYGRS